MRWEVINTPKPPECIFCYRNSEQMARFPDNTNQYKYICSNCARFVKDCMNEWKELKSTNYISDLNTEYGTL